MILIITNKADAHVEPVAKHLDALGVDWIRINTEDAAQNMDVSIDPTLGAGRIAIRDSAREFEIREVDAVWYRKPENVDLSHLDIAGGARDYVEAEYREILDGIYALLMNRPWINNPFRTRAAHRKLLQLAVARHVGLRTPRTLVTNKVEDVFALSDAVGADLAIKSLGALSVVEGEADQATQYGIFTRRVSRSELEAVRHQIPNLPTTFQPFIQKRCELRITCVGRTILACMIEARTGDITADDYRFDTKNLKHTAVEVPELSDRLIAYMSELGLSFACFDFIVPNCGEPIFLEANANGQWLWVERLTGLPIAASIAEELTRRAPS